MAALIVKVTESCNARCVYCDVVRKEAPPVSRMDEPLLDLLFRRVAEFLTTRPDEGLSITWHGGEPLLMGADFYRRARVLQERHLGSLASRVRHGMQTNLTLLDEDLADSLRGLGLTHLGSSYEFLPGIRRLGPGLDSDLYRRSFLEGARRAERAGFSWGVIYVVTRPALHQPDEVLFHLTNLRPEGNVLLNPVLLYDGEPAQLAVTPDEYADFLGALFRLWWPRRERLGPIQPLASLVDALVHHRPCLGCEDAGLCAGTHLNLDPSGRLSLCGRAADWGLHDDGNLADTTLDGALTGPARSALRGRSARLAQGPCGHCRFFPLCHGGCPLDGWAAAGSLDAPTFRCVTKRRFIEEHLEPVTGVRYGEPA